MKGKEPNRLKIIHVSVTKRYASRLPNELSASRPMYLNAIPPMMVRITEMMKASESSSPRHDRCLDEKQCANDFVYDFQVEHYLKNFSIFDMLIS